MVLFRERHVLGGKPLFAVYRSPRRGRVTAPQKLLIDTFVATPTIRRRHRLTDDESVVILLLLLFRRLMAVEAVDTFLRVNAQLVLMDDRVLLPGVTLCALTRRAD
jgi:hypothetical protein